MDGDRATIIADGSRGRAPRPLRVGLHLGVLAALVLGSGAVAGHAPSRSAPARAAPRHYDGPQLLHRYSHCCKGSSDPSMEVF